MPQQFPSFLEPIARFAVIGLLASSLIPLFFTSNLMPFFLLLPPIFSIAEEFDDVNVEKLARHGSTQEVLAQEALAGKIKEELTGWRLQFFDATFSQQPTQEPAE